jgi:hypothetical protein
MVDEFPNGLLKKRFNVFGGGTSDFGSVKQAVFMNQFLLPYA